MLLLLSTAAFGFGGGYFGDAPPTSTGGHVVLARNASDTVLTLAPEASGTGPFALVVPLEALPSADSVRLGAADALATLDAFTAPRLVSYTCEDLAPFRDTGFYGYYYYYPRGTYVQTRDYVYTGPFQQRRGRGALYCEGGGCGNQWYGPYGYWVYDDDDDTGIGGGSIVTWAQDDAAWEATYDVAVLPATDRDALLAWLGAHDLSATTEQQALIGEYLGAGRGFLAAHVSGAGTGRLPALQVTVPGSIDTLPVRLGLPHSTGAQDLVVYVLDPDRTGRAEISEWAKATVADQCLYDVDLDRAAFTDAYRETVAALIEAAGAQEGDTDPPDTDVTDTDVTDTDVTDTDVTDTDVTVIDTDVTANDSDTDVAANDTDVTDTDVADTDVDVPDGPDFAGWVIEFSGAAEGCDPCTATLTSADLALLGLAGSPALPDVQVTRLRLRYSRDGVAADPLLATRTGADVSLEFIAYENELETEFPVCGEGFVDNPDSCADGQGRRRGSGRRAALPDGAGAAVVVAGLGLWARRRRG